MLVATGPWATAPDLGGYRSSFAPPERMSASTRIEVQLQAPERFPPHADRPTAALAVDVVTDGSNSAEVRLRGEIDIVTLPTLDDTLRAMVGRGSGDVVIDMADVEFIGVAGLELLCSHARELRRRGHRLVLSSPSALTRRVIDVLGVAEDLSLPDDESRYIPHGHR